MTTKLAHKSPNDWLQVWKTKKIKIIHQAMKQAMVKARSLYFMNKKKGFPTKMKVADDLNTLVLYKDANEMKSQASDPAASNLDHLLSMYIF